MGVRQYKRAMAVRFGLGSTLLTQLVPDPVSQGLAPGSQLLSIDDSGLRMSFDFQRNNRGEPDKGSLRIYGLRERIRNSILLDMQALQAEREFIQRTPVAVLTDIGRAAKLRETTLRYQITVLAGYHWGFEPVFIGEMSNVSTSKRENGGTDIYVEIELGDSIEGFRSGYINQVFGTGTTMKNIADLVTASAGWRSSSDIQADISIVAPNAVLTQAANGFYAVGRPSETLDGIAEMFGVQWFVRNGEVFWSAQNTLLSGPAVVLQEGVNLIDLTVPRGFGDVQGRCLLNPRIMPGAGIILLKADGTRMAATGHRCNAVRHSGDTHGQTWYTDFEAGLVDIAVISPELALAELLSAP